MTRRVTSSTPTGRSPDTDWTRRRPRRSPRTRRMTNEPCELPRSFRDPVLDRRRRCPYPPERDHRVHGGGTHAQRCQPHARDLLPHPRGSARDRKSTRLNSSHVSISYAVFCLKKKSHSELHTF